MRIMCYHRQEKAKKELLVSLVISLAVSIAVIFHIPSPAAGGEWHKASKGTCRDCHPTHPGSRMMSVSKFSSKKTMLCLSCHSGARSKASNVFIQGNAAGFFPGHRKISRRGHDLGGISKLPGDRGTITLECTTCHDPHGNDNYRNLLTNPLNPKSVGIEVSAGEKDDKKKYQNIRYIKGISAWCQTCHSDLYDEQLNINRIVHHMVGKPLIGLNTVKSEQEPTVFVALPMDDPLGNTKQGEPASGNDDTTNCITCHYAHGWKNPYTLRYLDGKTLESTCNSCHVGGIKEKKTPAVKE